MIEEYFKFLLILLLILIISSFIALLIFALISTCKKQSIIMKRLTLSDFVETYIAHGSKLKLYSCRLVLEHETNKIIKELIPIASIEDYELFEDPDYKETHPEFEMSKYANWYVEEVLKCNGAIGTVSLIIRENYEI